MNIKEGRGEKVGQKRTTKNKLPNTESHMVDTNT